MWRLESLALEQDGERACSRLQQRDPKLNNQKLALLLHMLHQALSGEKWLHQGYHFHCHQDDRACCAVTLAEGLCEPIASHCKHCTFYVLTLILVILSCWTSFS
jgi:hypothetical protein